MTQSQWITEIERLVSPLGVVRDVVQVSSSNRIPDVKCYLASAGTGMPTAPLVGLPVTASGRALHDSAFARAVAIAEAAERYAGSEPRTSRFIRAPLRCPPGRTIDLDAIPRCSPAEYADPMCPVSPVDEHAEVRWTEGIELCSGKEIWIPAIMACYGLGRLPGERFWYPISTGYAVHTDIRKALFAAVSEVIERDLIAITWLQKLPLPRLIDTSLDADTARLVEWSRRHFIEPYLLDGTTDIGLPTVYALFRTPYDPVVMNSVACATGLTLSEAARKCVIDALTMRESLTTTAASKKPASLAVTLAMADPKMDHSFHFLTQTNEASEASAQPFASTEADGLAKLIKILAAQGSDVVVVDRTTRELASVGLVAVSAVIPALQPMSMHPAAQFRAHPRLFAAPKRMGYRVLAPSELNKDPQPFP